MGVDHEVPVVVGHLEQQVVPDDARAADEDVQPAELLDDSTDHALDLLPVRDVAGNGHAVDRCSHLLRRPGVHVRDHDPSALGREPLRRGGADAPSPARDQHDPIVEPHLVSVS